MNLHGFLLLMTYFGCRFLAASFISPCSPCFLFKENVCHISSEAPPTPIPMQAYEPTPAMYITMTSTSIPSSPPAKMNRYCAFNPLNSTVLPIPLLILYLFIRSRLQEKGLQDCSSHNKEDTGSKPAGCCFAGVRVAAAEFVVHLHTSD